MKRGGRDSAGHLVSATCLTLAAALLSLAALAATGGSPPRQGAGAVVFIYDASRSMAASDTAPSRAAVASHVIRSLLATYSGSAALVVLGGDAVTVAPLTPDLPAIGAALSEVVASGFNAGAGSTPAPALALALQLLETSASRSIVIVSDGEWTDTTGLPESIALARDRAVPISAVGIGTGSGAPIASARAPGGVHLSRLDRAALEALAADTGGRFAAAEDTSAIAANLATHGFIGRRAPQPWFVTGSLLLAIVLIAADAARHRGSSSLLRVLPVGALVFAAACGPAMDAGNRRFDAGDYDGAAAAFREVAARGPFDRSAASFNLALSLANSDDMEAAAAAFGESALRLTGGPTRAIAHFNRGVALAALARYAESADAFIDALRHDPSLDDARYNLMIVRARAGHPADRSNQTDTITETKFMLPDTAPRRASTAADW